MPDDVPLKLYLDQRLTDLDRRFSERFDAADRALSKAEASLQEYKASSNEWRGALRDASGNLVTRTEFSGMAEQVQALRRDKANLDGRLLVLSGGVSAAVAAVLWAFGHFVK